MSKLYVGGPFKQNNGNAITNTAANVNTGVQKAAGSDANGYKLKKSALGQGDNLNPVVVGRDGVDIAKYVLIDAVSAFANVGGLASLTTPTEHGLKKGDSVMLYDSDSGGSDFPTYVVSVVDSTTVVVGLTHEFVSGRPDITASGSLYKPSGTFATLEKNNTIMRGYAHNAHGDTVSKYQSGQSERDMNYSTKSIRTTRVATAITAGYYNVQTGKFTTEPTSANDYGAEMTPAGGSVPDKEAQNNTTNKSRGGGFVMRTGQPTPTIKNHTSNDT